MNLTQLDEPDLEFAAGSRHVDPRHGITDYGPADAASTAVRTIRCGVVGTPQAIDGLRRWLDRCRQPIPGKKSRLARLFMPFPGFDTSAGFRSTLIFDSRLERPLRDRDLTNLASLNPAKAVRSAVDLYMEELSILNEEPGCDVVLVARPDDLPEGIQEAGPRRGRRSRGGPATEDFRAQLKAEAMRHSHPLQLIRRTTWDPAFRPPDAKGRSLQDEAPGRGTSTPPCITRPGACRGGCPVAPPTSPPATSVSPSTAPSAMTLSRRASRRCSTNAATA